MPSPSELGSPLLASLLYYSLTHILGRMSRALIRQHVPLARGQVYLLDAVTTFQCMACSLENTHIGAHYGIWAYLTAIFLLSMVHMITTDISSNPCGQVDRYMRGRQDGRETLKRVLSQLVGGLLSYRYAQQFWRLGLHDGHILRSGQLHCSTHLNVNPAVGFGVEFSATLFDAVLAAVTFTSYETWEVAGKCLLTCYMVVLGLDLTGMYLNPVNATNQTFGCHGTSIPAHLLVYWGGPILAIVVSFYIEQGLARLRTDSRKNKDDENGVEHERPQEVSLIGPRFVKRRPVRPETA